MDAKEKEPLGKRLERLRKQRELTAKAVAREIDVAESTYREWEYGRGLKLPPWQRLSRLLGVSVTELVTGETPEWQMCLNELEVIEKMIRELRLKLTALI